MEPTYFITRPHTPHSPQLRHLVKLNTTSDVYPREQSARGLQHASPALVTLAGGPVGFISHDQLSSQGPSARFPELTDLAHLHVAGVHTLCERFNKDGE